MQTYINLKRNNILLPVLNIKINVALSENASRTRYIIKIEVKLRK